MDHTFPNDGLHSSRVTLQILQVRFTIRAETALSLTESE